MITENNEIPPYQRLARSVTDGRDCLRSYSVVLEKSDLKSSTALLSLRECQRVSVPTASVAMNSRIKILERFCMAVFTEKMAQNEAGILRRNRSHAKEILLALSRASDLAFGYVLSTRAAPGERSSPLPFG